jgi:hypothetical protein
MTGKAKEFKKVKGTHSLSSTKQGTGQDSKESQPTRGTDVLSSEEREDGQDSERRSVSEGLSRSVERRARD